MAKPYGHKLFGGSAVVLAYMRGHQGRIDTRGGMSFNDTSAPHVRLTLSKLRQRGLVVWVSRGVYRLASTTPTASPRAVKRSLKSVYLNQARPPSPQPLPQLLHILKAPLLTE